MSRLARYIADNALGAGHVLGTNEYVARLLRCGIDAVADEIAAAEAMGVVRRDDDGRTVVQSPLVYPAEMSFTHSALALKQKIETFVLKGKDGNDLIEVRLPDSEDATLEPMEKRAQESLGLGAGDPFIVIPRVRVIDGKRGALHRVYLDPARFPPNFLEAHDFSKEAMIRMYAAEGYELLSRDTTLRARWLYDREKFDFELLFGAPFSAPILDAEQILWARDPKTGDRFPLEFLQATYLHWEYRITNRPPPQAG